MKIMIKTSTLAVIFVFSVTAQAENSENHSGMGLKLPQSIDTRTHTISTIDRATIKMMGALTIGDALSLVPGFVVGSINASSEAIAYQGMSDEFPRRTQVLVNGRSIFLPTSGGVNWKNIPVKIDDVERIEVVHGPSVAVSGNNALLGTINIITRSARESEQTKLDVTQGSNGEQMITGRASYTNDIFATSISLYDQRDDDGYDKKNTIAPFDDSYKNQGSIFRVDADLNRLYPGSGELSIEIGASQNRANLGGYIAPWTTQPNNYEAPFVSNNKNNYQHISWRKHKNDYIATVRLSRMEDSVIENRSINAYNIGQFPYEEAYKGTRYDIGADITKSISHNLTLSTGLGFQSDHVESQSLLGKNSPQRNNSTIGFARLEWQPEDDWTFSAMLAISDNSLSGTNAAPTLSADYGFAPGHNIRVSYTEGYRQPMSYEVYADKAANLHGLGNIQFVQSSSDISHERNRTIDAAWTYKPDRIMKTTVRAYYSKLDDLITPYLRHHNGLTAIPGAVMDFKNQSNINLQGIENSVTWNDDGWVVRGAYTISQVRNNTPCNPMSYDLCALTESGQPTQNIALLVGKQLDGGWSLSATYQYITGFKWMWINYPNVGSNDYLDARIAKRWREGRADVEAALLGKNLLGDVRDFRSDAAWSPSVYLQFSVSFF